jgi:hypothetical protein
VTLLQNLYQFQAGENARNAASGKAFMQDRTTEGPTVIREDPKFLRELRIYHLFHSIPRELQFVQRSLLGFLDELMKHHKGGSEQCENDAGGLFQHSANRPFGLLGKADSKSRFSFRDLCST